MAQVVAQVSFQAPSIAPGLEDGRPACQHPQRATGLELGFQGDLAPAVPNRDHRPGVAGEGDERRQILRLVGQRAPSGVIGDKLLGHSWNQPDPRRAHAPRHWGLLSTSAAAQGRNGRGRGDNARPFPDPGKPRPEHLPHPFGGGINHQIRG